MTGGEPFYSALLFGNDHPAMSKALRILMEALDSGVEVYELEPGEKFDLNAHQHHRISLETLANILDGCEQDFS